MSIKIKIKGCHSLVVEGLEPAVISRVIEDALVGNKATVTTLKRGPRPKAQEAK